MEYVNRKQTYLLDQVESASKNDETWYVYIICQVSSRGRRLADPFHCSECCIEIANRQGGSRAEYEKINWLVAKFCSLASKTLGIFQHGEHRKTSRIVFKGPFFFNNLSGLDVHVDSSQRVKWRCVHSSHRYVVLLQWWYRYIDSKAKVWSKNPGKWWKGMEREQLWYNIL